MSDTPLKSFLARITDYAVDGDRYKYSWQTVRQDTAGYDQWADLEAEQAAPRSSEDYDPERHARNLVEQAPGWTGAPVATGATVRLFPVACEGEVAYWFLGPEAWDESARGYFNLADGQPEDEWARGQDVGMGVIDRGLTDVQIDFDAKTVSLSWRDRYFDGFGRLMSISAQGGN